MNWKCSACPFTTTNPGDVFLHRREGPPVHHVTIVEERALTGIEKEFLRQEIARDGQLSGCPARTIGVA